MKSKGISHIGECPDYKKMVAQYKYEQLLKS